MNNHPSISIIIPVYNVEQYVEKCVNSIMSQTYTDFEAIIVDDGSKDKSIDICEKLIKHDSRFKILHKKNGGLMSAWKFGLKHALGEYIGFVDSDDWVDSNMYYELHKSIKEYDADIVVSGYITENDSVMNRWTRDKLYVFEGDAIRNAFIKDYCCSYFHSTSNPSICRWDKLYKKDILQNNLSFFNENISLAEDFNTNIAVLLDARKIVLLPNFTPYHYRYNPKSIVNTINPKAFYNIKELGNTCSDIQKLKQFKSVYVESFIGNIIFEEINRICRSISFSNLKSEELYNNIELCNGYHYLNCYAHVRSALRINVYNWFIQHKFIKVIKFLTVLNILRS